MKFLLKSLIITLVTFTFVGCKSSTNGNKVTTHRSNQGKIATKTQEKTEPKTTQGADENMTKTGTETHAGEETTSDSDSKVCEEKNPSGWESHALSLRVSSQTQESGIQVHYLVPNNSSFKNPVLVLINQLEPLSTELTERILEASKKFEFDPILVDSRGTGCSTPLPKDKKNWNQFTAEKVAEDAELIRRQVLRDKKWKIWSFQNSALVALKMVELYPTTISSLHIADFTIAKTPLDQEKNKLFAQIQAWTKFKDFSKTNGFEITDEVMSKIEKVLLNENSCKKPSVCKLDLWTSLIDFLSDNDEKWKEAMEIVKLLSEGEISKELLEIAEKNKKNYLYNQLLVAAHVDSDPNLIACDQALNDEKLKKQAELTPIKSCLVDLALKESYLTDLKGKIQHKKMNYGLIQKNMKTEKIVLHLAVAERSLLNPLISAKDTVRLITGESELETLLTPGTEYSFEIFFHEQLLKSLK